METKMHSWSIFGPASNSVCAPAGSSETSAASGRSHRRVLLMAISLVVALNSMLLMPGAVGSDDANIEKYAVRRVQPAYPPLAQKQRIEGVVVMQLSVGGDGKVNEVVFVRGNNIFRAVSLDAARKWEFRPPGGAAIQGTIRFIFKLES